MPGGLDNWVQRLVVGMGSKVDHFLSAVLFSDIGQALPSSLLPSPPLSFVDSG